MEVIPASLADLLLTASDSLATAITEALYHERPQLAERYGAVGRARCLEDVRFNLEHLAAAAAVRQTAVFSDYIRWVDALLRARDVDPSDLARSLEITADVLRAAAPDAPDLAEVLAVLHAGIAVLHPPAGSHA